MLAPEAPEPLPEFPPPHSLYPSPSLSYPALSDTATHIIASVVGMPLAVEKLQEFLADQKDKLTARAMSDKAYRRLLEQDRGLGESLTRLFGARVDGPLAAWRASHPDALAANLEGRTDLTSADFVHLRGIECLNMRGCNQPALGDAAFAHLEGIQVLNMSGCNQSTITDAAFRHLEGIQTLTMSCCSQRTAASAASLTQPL